MRVFHKKCVKVAGLKFLMFRFSSRVVPRRAHRYHACRTARKIKHDSHDNAEPYDMNLLHTNKDHDLQKKHTG